MTRRQSTIAAQGYARQPCSRITLGQCRSHCQQVGKRAEIPRNQAEPLIEASHLAIDAKAARLGLQHPTQHLQQTRFAAAIATAEQTALTPLQHQINPLAMPAHVRRSRNHQRLGSPLTLDLLRPLHDERLHRRQRGCCLGAGLHLRTVAPLVAVQHSAKGFACLFRLEIKQDFGLGAALTPPLTGSSGRLFTHFCKLRAAAFSLRTACAKLVLRAACTSACCARNSSNERRALCNPCSLSSRI